MGLARRGCGLLFGAAGAVGMIASVAAVVGVWVAYSEAMTRTDRVFGEAERSVGEVRDNLRQAADRLRQTKAELEAARTPEPARPGGRKRELPRKSVEALGPQIGEVRTVVAKATEIGLTANGVLDALAELPAVERVHIDTDRLKETSAQLSEVVDRSARLAAILARAAPEPDDLASRESSRIEEGLARTIELADAGAEKVGDGRERIAAGHARIRFWIRCAAAVITLVLIWVAAGQMSLLARGWGLVRHRRAPPGQGQVTT